jgi:hypothetical protein
MVTLITSGIVLFAAFYFSKWLFNTRVGRHPPGPSGLPLVGNLLKWPKQKAWLTFARWADLYGES